MRSLMNWMLLKDSILDRIFCINSYRYRMHIPYTGMQVGGHFFQIKYSSNLPVEC
jgi:hypothetical protein